MPRVYFGLGSNVGDSEAIFAAAFDELGKLVREARLSGIWHSRPRYVADQPSFLNAVAMGDTDHSPRELLAAVNRIEASFGRDRSSERLKGPRSLDIDILLYGNAIIAEPDLIIPHPGLRDRKFALLPLLELDPCLSDPVSGELYSLVLASLPPQGIYLRLLGGYDPLYL